jgi:hypothetical protein
MSAENKKISQIAQFTHIKIPPILSCKQTGGKMGVIPGHNRRGCGKSGLDKILKEVRMATAVGNSGQNCQIYCKRGQIGRFFLRSIVSFKIGCHFDCNEVKGEISPNRWSLEFQTFHGGKISPGGISQYAIITENFNTFFGSPCNLPRHIAKTP